MRRMEGSVREEMEQEEYDKFADLSMTKGRYPQGAGATLDV